MKITSSHSREGLATAFANQETAHPINALSFEGLPLEAELMVKGLLLDGIFKEL